MSFGFSVGDFITVANLITDIVGSLKDSGDPKSDYQELVEELENLDRVLKSLDRFRAAPPHRRV
jgi:hypothetical protein